LLCTLRNRCRQQPRNTRYQAGATPYLSRTFTGWTAPASAGALIQSPRRRWRVVARRDSRGLRLFTRNGYNFAGRFPTIVAAIASLPVRSCLIDGEAIVVDESGLPVFELLRYRPCFALSILTLALSRRWRSRPQHQKRTHALQQYLPNLIASGPVTQKPRRTNFSLQWRLRQGPPQKETPSLVRSTGRGWEVCCLT
jgi:hypothetical protein